VQGFIHYPEGAASFAISTIFIDETQGIEDVAFRLPKARKKADKPNNAIPPLQDNPELSPEIRTP